MLIKKEFSTAAQRRVTVGPEPLSRRQQQRPSNPMRATHTGGAAGHPATEAQGVIRRQYQSPAISRTPHHGEAAQRCVGRHPSPCTWRTTPAKGEPMKRLKRNRIQRAFDKGYQLGLAGRSKENCPFLTGLARSKWLEGWREGRNDWREGLTDALTCYKLSGF